MYELKFDTVGCYSLDFDGSDLATTQYTAVALGNSTGKSDGTGRGKAALQRPEAGKRCLGLLQANGRENESIEVCVSGLSGGKISGSAAGGKIGQALAAGADGQLVEATGGQFVVAYAHEDYSAGDITTVFVSQFGKA